MTENAFAISFVVVLSFPGCLTSFGSCLSENLAFKFGLYCANFLEYSVSGPFSFNIVNAISFFNASSIAFPSIS